MTRAWAKLALLVGSTAVVLVPLELWARSRFDKLSTRLTQIDASAARKVDREHLRLVDIVRPSAAADLIYELVPGVTGRFQDAPYSANSHGMRDRELPEVKPADVYRIALIGDSFAFGWGVDSSACFARLMETQLDKVGNRRVEVLNFGVPGYNTALEAACLERKALAFAPDLVLVQFYFNDYYLPNFLLSEVDKPASCLVALVLELLGKRPPIANTLELPSRSGGIGERDSAVAQWKKDPELVPPEYAYMVGEAGVDTALVRMKTACDARGIPLVLMILDIPPAGMLKMPPGDPRITGAMKQIADLAAKRSIPSIDLLPGFVAQLQQLKLETSDVVLSDADWHPNPKGHVILARLIAQMLREKNLLR